jgi:SPP1 gp7 family putative phage head morphogenesis protein
MGLISGIVRGLGNLVKGIARGIRGAMRRGEAETEETQQRVYVWVTAHDEKVCPQCNALDGTEYVITANSQLTDLLLGAHPNCRCPQFSRVEYR